MISDPIVDEVRTTARNISNKYNNDFDAIVKHIKEKEKEFLQDGWLFTKTEDMHKSNISNI